MALITVTLTSSPQFATMGSPGVLPLIKKLGIATSSSPLDVPNVIVSVYSRVCPVLYSTSVSDWMFLPPHHWSLAPGRLQLLMKPWSKEKGAAVLVELKQPVVVVLLGKPLLVLMLVLLMPVVMVPLPVVVMVLLIPVVVLL